MSSRTTVRTIERGVRSGPKGVLQARSLSNHRSSSPIIETVRQQLTAFVDHSQLEKSELSKLNDRMAAYVNRVKQLENENTKLMNEIQDRQSSWGDDTRKVRELYEQSLFDARGQIDDVANLKTTADIRNKRAQYLNLEYQHRVDESLRSSSNTKNKIKNLEFELEGLKESKLLLNRSLEDANKDIEKYRKGRDDTWESVVDLLDRLDEELYKRIAVEYNNQTLREHIEFVKQINEKELLEMSQLSNALPFNDQVEFYKDQLKRVISNIRKDYEDLNNEQAREMEEWMKVKTDEMASKLRQSEELNEIEMSIQIENLEQLRDAYDLNYKELDDLKQNYDSLAKKLNSLENHIEQERLHLNQHLDQQNDEIRRINGDLDGLTEDCNLLSTNKASLEYELHVYKRLLDSQLNKLQPSKAETVKANESQTSSVSSNQFGGKVQNKKEKKGSIGIGDSSPDGKFIVIENVGPASTQIDLSGWIIKRKFDSSNETVYKIPSGIVLAPNKEVVVWAKTYSSQRGQNDLVADFENWGIGINSTTRLLNPNGEEKSSFNQQISFSSPY